MAKTITFPVYVAKNVRGEIIAGPSTDCLRMNIAAESYESFSGVPARTVWVETLTAQEARILNGKEE